MNTRFINAITATVASTTILCLTGRPAAAYESDIHYSVTYALARATGWPQADAMVIASANQGVDENRESVAALEVDLTPLPFASAYLVSSFHQAARNFRFHCFSTVEDKKGTVSSDVLAAKATRTATIPSAATTAEQHTRRLIAIGVALHCLQDSYSHNGYGGRCGSYQGNCLGHSLDSWRDSVSAQSRTNPDHPAAPRWGLEPALTETAAILMQYRGALKPKHVVASTAIAALSRSLSSSGRNLADADRRSCNRYIAGRWLHEQLGSAGGPGTLPEKFDTVPPGLLTACLNSSNAVPVINIPNPEYPRLKTDAAPVDVYKNGQYERVDRSLLDVWMPLVKHEQLSDLKTGSSTYKVTVEVSGRGQALPAAFIIQAIVLSGSYAPFGVERWIESRNAASISKDIEFNGPRLGDYALQVEIRPADGVANQWSDKDISNDRLGCAVDSATNPGTTVMSGDLAQSWKVSCQNPLPDVKKPSPPTSVEVQ